MSFDLGGFAGGVIGGAASLVGGLHADKTAEGIARMQNNSNLSMMREMNEYNKPINQMNRLKEAGLNANLMYGAISPGNQTTPVQAVAPHTQGKGAIISKAVQDAMNTAISLDTTSKKLDLENKKLENDSLRIDNQHKEALLRLDFDKYRQGVLEEQFGKQYGLQERKFELLSSSQAKKDYEQELINRNLKKYGRREKPETDSAEISGGIPGLLHISRKKRR